MLIIWDGLKNQILHKIFTGQYDLLLCQYICIVLPRTVGTIYLALVELLYFTSWFFCFEIFDEKYIFAPNYYMTVRNEQKKFHSLEYHWLV